MYPAPHDHSTLQKNGGEAQLRYLGCGIELQKTLPSSEQGQKSVCFLVMYF